MLATEMNTVCLLGSPRRDCNSDTLAKNFMQQAKLHGAPRETFALSELRYSGCINLFRCKTGLEHCGQTDELTPVLTAISQAQVLVLASPVYFTSVSGQLKLAIDRFFSFFVPDYPTAETKSRLSPHRHLVLLQTQGEPEDKYEGLLESFSASFRGLGFDQQHLVRAWGVRNPGDINQGSSVLQHCNATAASIYKAT
jgi:multimeric flavodoxin WrbA